MQRCIEGHEAESLKGYDLNVAGELARLEGDASTSAPPHGPPNLALWQKGKAQSSRAHLETRIAAALVLESQAEYRRWLLTYARHLAGRLSDNLVHLRWPCEIELKSVLHMWDLQKAFADHFPADEQDSSRLREICEELLGPLRPAHLNEHDTGEKVEGELAHFCNYC